MTTIAFNCPHCGQPFQTDASRAGAQGTCPKCKGSVVVPEPQPVEPILAAEPAPQPPPPKSIGSCPYCRGEMMTSDTIRACPNCETPHHRECWDENKGCTVFGCSMAPPEEEKVSVQVPNTVPGQIDPSGGPPSPYDSQEDFELVYEKAGLGRRFGNYVLDYVLFLASVFFVWMFIAIVCEVVGWDFESLLQIEFFVNLLVYAGYYILFEATLGRTPAKFVTGTRVMTPDFGKPSIEQIVGRSFSRIVPFEPFSFFGQDKSGWHDRWSGTTVVMAKPIPRIVESYTPPDPPPQLAVPTSL